MAAPSSARDEALKEQVRAEANRFATERARAEREAEKAGKAIEAFSALAERLDALAAERVRPWWRRLVG
jgi:hypothetical protein